MAPTRLRTLGLATLVTVLLAPLTTANAELKETTAAFAPPSASITDRMIAQLKLASLNAAGYADEMRDYGVQSSEALRPLSDIHSPTPTTLPGAATITTAQLRGLMTSGQKPVLLDVLGGALVDTLPGAVWLNGAGLGRNFEDGVQARLAAKVEALAGGDKTRPIVVFCLSSMCWLSYNTGLRLVKLGYRQVYWYRGGREAWRDAGLPFAFITDMAW